MTLKLNNLLNAVSYYFSVKLNKLVLDDFYF